jgi:hypothetical protein
MSLALTTYSSGKAIMGKPFHLAGLYFLMYLCLPVWALGQGVYSGGSGSPEDLISDNYSYFRRQLKFPDIRQRQ